MLTADPYAAELAQLKADAVLRAQARYNHTLPDTVRVVFRRFGNKGGGRWEARSERCTSRCADEAAAIREAWWLVACADADQQQPVPRVRYVCSGCDRTDDDHPFNACAGATWAPIETSTGGFVRVWELQDGSNQWEVVDIRGEGSTLMIGTRADCEAEARTTYGWTENPD